MKALLVAAAVIADAINLDRMVYRNPFANRPTVKRGHSGRLNRLVHRQHTVNAKRMERYVG